MPPSVTTAAHGWSPDERDRCPSDFHGFLPPPATIAAGLGGVGALTSSSELSDDNLVDQRDVSLDILGGNAEDRASGASTVPVFWPLSVGDVQT